MIMIKSERTSKNKVHVNINCDESHIAERMIVLDALIKATMKDYGMSFQHVILLSKQVNTTGLEIKVTNEKD